MMMMMVVGGFDDEEAGGLGFVYIGRLCENFGFTIGGKRGGLQIRKRSHLPSFLPSLLFDDKNR